MEWNGILGGPRSALKIAPGPYKVARREKSSIFDIMEIAHPGSFFRFFRDVNVAQIAPHFDWTIKMLCAEFSTCYIKLPNGDIEPMPHSNNWRQGRISRRDLNMAIADEPNDFPFPGSPRGDHAPPDYTYTDFPQVEEVYAYPYFPHLTTRMSVGSTKFAPPSYVPPSPTYGNPDTDDEWPISIRRDELKAQRNMHANTKAETDRKAAKAAKPKAAKPKAAKPKRRRLRKTRVEFDDDNMSSSCSDTEETLAKCRAYNQSLIFASTIDLVSESETNEDMAALRRR